MPLYVRHSLRRLAVISVTLTTFTLAPFSFLSAVQGAPAVTSFRNAWKGTYQRFAFDLSGQPRTTVVSQGPVVEIRVSGTNLSPSSNVITVPGDQIQVTLTAQTVTFKSLNNLPLRVNNFFLRKEGGTGTLVLDVYPQSAWLDYVAPAGVTCPLGSGGQEWPYVAPPFATGSVGFYMARIDPKTLAPTSYVANQPDALFP